MTKEKEHFWSLPKGRKITTAILGALFVLAFIVYIAADLVSSKILNSKLYTNALEENDIYNRVYTQLLADPALEQMTSSLLGGIGLEGLGEDVFSLATSTLYLVLPPETIQNATEKAINNSTVYLKGETPFLEPRIDLSSQISQQILAERILIGLEQRLLDNLINSKESEDGAGRIIDSVAIDAFGKKLSEGQLSSIPPEVLTVKNKDITPADKKEINNVLQELVEGKADQLVGLQIEGAVASGDIPSAVLMTARVLLSERVNLAAKDAFDNFSKTEVLDVVTTGALYLEQTEEQFIDKANTIRDWMVFLDKGVIPITILIMAVSMALIVWLNSENIVQMFRSSGYVLVAAGGVTVSIWVLVRYLLIIKVPILFSGGSSQLPISLKLMISDVVTTVLKDLWTSVWLGVLAVFIVGAVLIGISHAKNLTKRLKKLLEPVWNHRTKVFVGLTVVLVALPPLVKFVYEEYKKEPQRCNGYEELCGRRFDEVVFPATHNGMSITEYKWLWPSQDGSVTNQLNFGIRALLIDTHYFDVTSSVERYFPDATEEELAVVQEIVDNVGLESREGTYLCHILCHIGSTPYVDTLKEIKTFLDENPNEVVVLILEDKITVEDAVKAYEEAGLITYTYSHKKSAKWPTLGQMIKDNKRLVVTSETGGPPPDWYHNVWDIAQETPFAFSDPTEFNCDPNRGGTDKDLFLLNHWINRVSPSRVDATQVNAYDFLLARARQCQKERGQIPNFLAVNFYLIGDVVRVANTLNGVDRD